MSAMVSSNSGMLGMPVGSAARMTSTPSLKFACEVSDTITMTSPSCEMLKS